MVEFNDDLAASIVIIGKILKKWESRGYRPGVFAVLIKPYHRKAQTQALKLSLAK